MGLLDSLYYERLGQVLVIGILLAKNDISADYNEFTADWHLVIYNLLNGLFIQFTMMKSLHLEPNSSIVAVISSLSIISSMVFDILFYGVAFEVHRVFGGMIVFVAVSVLAFQKGEDEIDIEDLGIHGATGQ